MPAPKRSKDAVVPAPTQKTVVRNKFAVMGEQNSRALRHLLATRPIGEAIEFLCRWTHQEFDMLDVDAKSIAHDPRYTKSDRTELLAALDGVSNRVTMFRAWLSGEETVEQRKYRLAHGMFLDDSDRDFLKELLLEKN